MPVGRVTGSSSAIVLGLGVGAALFCAPYARATDSGLDPSICEHAGLSDETRAWCARLDVSGEGSLVGPRAFVGLWQGIDTFDGSTQQLSVTCADQTTCDVRLNDTLFSDCGGGGGFAQGVGVIENGVLTVAEFVLTCQNGDTLMDSEMFVPDFGNGTLIDIEDPPTSPFPKIFHKISR